MTRVFSFLPGCLGSQPMWERYLCWLPHMHALRAARSVSPEVPRGTAALECYLSGLS